MKRRDPSMLVPSLSTFHSLIATETTEHTNSSMRPRVTQRRPQACTECARRKLRCSKVIPCGACLERGISHLCQREKVRLCNKQAKDPAPLVPSNQDKISGNVEQRPAGDRYTLHHTTPSASCLPDSPSMRRDIDLLFGESHISYVNSQTVMSGFDNDQSSAIPIATAREPVVTPGGSSEEGLSPLISLPLTGGVMSGVVKDSAVTLEFLALSRQRVMKLGHNLAPESSASLPADFANIVDPIVTPAQARWLIEYHENNISWMHNVLHMAIFREQCEVFLESGTLTSPLWLPLYYTVLSVSSSCISST